MNQNTVQVFTKHDQAFEYLRWVASARSTDKTRAVLQGILITAEREIVATDGRRLHYVESTKENDVGLPVGFAPGIYYVERMNTKEICLRLDDTGATYPNWKAVCVSPQALSHIIKISRFQRRPEDTASFVVADLHDITKGYYQHAYILDAVSCGYCEEMEMRVDCLAGGDATRIPICLDIGNTHAVIMPMDK